MYTDIAIKMKPFNDQLSHRKNEDMDIEHMWTSFRDALQAAMNDYNLSYACQPWITGITKKDKSEKTTPL